MPVSAPSVTDSAQGVTSAGPSPRLSRALPKAGLSITRYGTTPVLSKSGTGQEAGLIESPQVAWDPVNSRYAMVYTGYQGSIASPTNAALQWATSTDLLSWTKQGTLLLYSGTIGAADRYGCAGGYLRYDPSSTTWYVFYCGFNAPGYEVGTSICYATMSTLGGTATRQGAIITTNASDSGSSVPTWRQKDVWRPNIVQRGSTWYLFFNTSDNSDVERIGYATASSLNGPWTVDTTNSPVLNVGTAGTWDSKKVADPWIYRIGGTWYMKYFGYNTTVALEGVATTTDASFPLGWTKYAGNPINAVGSTGQFDAKFAHKPGCILTPGGHYHYYTGVAADNDRAIGLYLGS